MAFRTGGRPVIDGLLLPSMRLGLGNGLLKQIWPALVSAHSGQVANVSDDCALAPFARFPEIRQIFRAVRQLAVNTMVARCQEQNSAYRAKV